MNDSDSTKGAKEAEISVRGDCEARYETIVRTAMNGFWLVDADGRFLDVNDAYCRMTGYSREEMLGMRVSDIEAKEAREEVAGHMRKVAEHGHDRFETRHRCRDGRIIDLEVSANYLDSGGGRFFVFLRDLTGPRKNDAKLRVLSSAVEQSGTAVLITDAAGVIEYVNPQFSAMTGYSASELLGRKPSILKSGVHGAAFYADIWKTITSGRPWRGDICNRKKNGELYWELRRISPIMDASGEITHYVSIQIEDIERKKAEEALKESELRYRMLHLASFDGIIMADSSGKISECNPSAERIFGYGHGGMNGMALTELMPERLRARYLAGFERFLLTGEKNGQNILVETEGIKKSGEEFPVEIIVNSLYVNSKLFITVTVRDISERKKTEEKLRKSEERLAEAQRIARIGNWEWDIAAGLVWWSDEVYRVFGFQPHEVDATYETFINAVHPEDRERVRRSLDDAIHNKAPYRVQHRIVLPGGDVRIIHGRGEVEFDGNGAPVRMMGTAQDITECKIMETEIHKAQKLESLGVLAGGIAHDFNNILTGIVGNVFLMKKAAPATDNAIAERLGVIDSAVTRAKGLTQKLLTFSSGGAPVKVAVDLAKAATETARLVFSGSRVTFGVDAQNGLWTVEADEGQIDQVFQNICANALQAMPEGGRLNIRLENRLDAGELPLPAGRYVKITLADNGPGIPNEHIPRIFDPFFTTKAGGNGLGLSICFSIIKKHSGFMKADSSAMGGAAFSIYLPAMQTTGAKETEASAPRQRLDAPRRILVMDDEEMVRDTALAILTELGYKVVLAPGGREALELYNEAMKAGTPFDLVIMDLTVQDGMGGNEAIGKLLSLDPEATAIVSSGYCNSPIMSDYKKYGFKGVLQKPYDVDEFSAVVKKALGEP
jgi:PAS domain S-box-containing protein